MVNSHSTPTTHPDAAIITALAAIKAADAEYSAACKHEESDPARFDAAGEAVSIADETFALTPAQTLAGLLIKLEQFAEDNFNALLLAEKIMLDARRLLAAG